jgi:hypothetical protein
MLDKSNVLKIEKQLKVAEKSLNTEDILLTKTANEWIDGARSLPPQVKLFGDFWRSGQVAILAGDTG